MQWVDRALAGVAAITRAMPDFPGDGRVFRVLNRAAMMAGAEPVVIAKMRDRSRIMVDLRGNTDVMAYYRGEYDSLLLGAIRQLIDPNSCMIDVGANIGFYAVAMGHYLRSRGASGKVIAFEPLPANYQRLLENLSLNDLDGYCVTHNVGLSNRALDTVITLREDFESGAKTGNAAIASPNDVDRGFSTASIRLARLDDVWSQEYQALGRIDLIKVDIEGHEDYFLEGAARTLNAHRPSILMQVNKPYYVARQVLLDERFLPLLPADYVIFRYVRGSWSVVKSLNECAALDNVFLVPAERLKNSPYAMFKAS